jgi:hypothetical protein
LSTLTRVLRLLQELLAKVAVDKGEATDPQPHATTMLKLAVQAAWAQLAISTSTQEFLKPTVEPHLATLCRLWFKTLREYGRLSLENDVLRSLGGFPLAIDVGSSLTYLEATRNVILPFYNESWLHIMRALTAAMNGEGIMESLLHQPDGQETEVADVFTILCGLCLRVISTEDPWPKGPKAETREAVVNHGLQAFGSLAVAGGGIHFLSQQFALRETLSVLDRAVDTFPVPVRINVSSTLQDVLSKMPSETAEKEAEGSGFAESQFLKLVVNICVHHLAGFSNSMRSECAFAIRMNIHLLT